MKVYAVIEEYVCDGTHERLIALFMNKKDAKKMIHDINNEDKFTCSDYIIKELIVNISYDKERDMSNL